MRADHVAVDARIHGADDRPALARRSRAPVHREARGHACAAGMGGEPDVTGTVALRHCFRGLNRSKSNKPPARQLPNERPTSLNRIWGRRVGKSSLCGHDQSAGEFADFGRRTARFVERRAYPVTGRAGVRIALEISTPTPPTASISVSAGNTARHALNTAGGMISAGKASVRPHLLSAPRNLRRES